MTFQSVINLKTQLERALLLLDLELADMSQIFQTLVEQLIETGMLEKEQKNKVLAILLKKRTFVEDNATSNVAYFRQQLSRPTKSDKKSKKGNKKESVAGGIMNAMTFLQMTTFGTAHVALPPSMLKDQYPIMASLPDDAEGALTLCAAVESLTEPIAAFIRLAESKVFNGALEIPLPLRFMFVVLTPKENVNIDAHEVGRSFSTLMSSKYLQKMCYSVESKGDLLNAINDFLAETVVLPAANWADENLLSFHKIQEMEERRKRLKDKWHMAVQKTNKLDEKGDKYLEKQPDVEKPGKEEKKSYDPFTITRSPYLFGGLINEWKKRGPLYVSDFKDGFDGQVISTALFIFFACLSGAIAFGGVLGETTGNRIGITETIITSSFAGILYSLFAGCPLIILGVTGPSLLFDQALWAFSQSNGIDFLAWRVWVGIWLIVVSLVVAAFQGSILVKHFTKFTKDIFTGLIALLFIISPFEKLAKIFKTHPLKKTETYCESQGSFFYNTNSSEVCNDKSGTCQAVIVTNFEQTQEIYPNTALLSVFLMIGTFYISYSLRSFKSGKLLGRTARKALGDFGVPIAILIMFLVDYFIDIDTEKLNVPDGLELTAPKTRMGEGHGWLINPFPPNFPVWVPIVSIVPAILFYSLMFMTTEISELLVMEKTMSSPNYKGAGVHWDCILISIVNCLGTLIGGPFILAAIVRAVAHVNALTVMSTNNAPGEPPSIVDVKDQRLSFLLVSMVLGCSVFLSSFLKLVPLAAMFGVFLYMGITSIESIQLFNRIWLFFTPVKHHPHVSYVRKVRTWKMHVYTFVQIIGLAILYTVSSVKSIALVFPFFVLLMLPLRWSLNYLPKISLARKGLAGKVFTAAELEALDGKDAGKFVRDED